MTRVVVIGGGISGLSAALAVRSHRRADEIIVLESAPTPGGKLRVAEVGGIAVDIGAEALLTRRPEGIDLIDAVGLTDERIDPLTTAASVYAGGRRHPLPARTLMGVPTSVDAARASGVLSAAALDRLGSERDAPPLEPLPEDVAVGTLIRSRLGDEVVDRLVDPLLGGVYAGSADALSLRATIPALAARLAAGGGSVLDAAAALTDVGPRDPAVDGPVFTSLRGGLGGLAGRIAASGLVEVRTSTTARRITRTPTGFRIEIGAAPEHAALDADAVIVATPPGKAARLLRDVAPAAADDLAGIETASMALVTLAFPAAAVASAPAGSGILVGARESLAVKAVTFSSQKWPLTSDGLVLLRASIGRAGDTTTLWREDDDLIALVRRDLRVLTGIDAEPVDALVTRWGGALPQYAVGHLDRVARIRAAVAQVPRLGVCGAAYDGIGIPACIASAYAAAGQVLAALPGEGE